LTPPLQLRLYRHGRPVFMVDRRGCL
jgi:hypothetical protein